MFSSFTLNRSEQAILRARAISGGLADETENPAEEKTPGTKPASIIPDLFAGIKNAKRINNFEKDYTALLVSLASAIRSGLDPISALCQSAALFPNDSEVAVAINKFKASIEKGLPEAEAIMDFASDIDHPDIDLFRSSFILARQEGSSIGECLHRLARVTRQRQSFRRKIKAAVAMQKLSAIGISGCAVVIGFIQYLSNPKAMKIAFEHPIGFKILLFGVGLIIAGMIWMLRISRTKV